LGAGGIVPQPVRQPGSGTDVALPIVGAYADSSVAVATGEEESRPSPALALQQQINEAWSEDARADPDTRWSPRATLLFSGSVAGLLWGAIAMAIYAATR
jgi:hypothetical protein